MNGHFFVCALPAVVMLASLEGSADPPLLEIDLNEPEACEKRFEEVQCMEAAHRPEEAITLGEKFLAEHPGCRHFDEVLFSLAKWYQALQRYDEAVDTYLRYLKDLDAHPPKPETVAALQNALELLLALERYNEALDLGARFAQSSSARQTAESQTIIFHLGFAYVGRADHPAVITYYEKFLTDYAKQVTADLFIEAHVHLADAYRLTSPPDESRAGEHYRKALERFEAEAKGQAGRAGQRMGTVAAAKAKYYLSLEACDAFRELALKAFDPGKTKPNLIKKWLDQKYEKGWQQFWRDVYKRETATKSDALEEYRVWQQRSVGDNRLVLPSGGSLQIDREDKTDYTKKISKTVYQKELQQLAFDWWSETWFQPWLRKKLSLLESALKQLAALLELHVPEWEIEAAAEAGDINDELAAALEEMPMPLNFAKDEKLSKIYRDALKDVAAPYRQVAKHAYEHCLNVALITRWVIPTAAHCAARLTETAPKEHPAIHEVIVEPHFGYEGMDIPDLAVPTEQTFDRLQ